MAPPPARRETTADVLHGVTVADPYRWLEDGDSPEVAAWVATHNERTRQALDARPSWDRWHERLDPPQDLLEVALSHGCKFAIDTDAHATGQLEWQVNGCEKAAEVGVPLERIVNTLAADDLLAWTASH